MKKHTNSAGTNTQLRERPSEQTAKLVRKLEGAASKSGLGSEAAAALNAAAALVREYAGLYPIANHLIPLHTIFTDYFPSAIGRAVVGERNHETRLQDIASLFTLGSDICALGETAGSAVIKAYGHGILILAEVHAGERGEDFWQVRDYAYMSRIFSNGDERHEVVVEALRATRARRRAPLDEQD